MRGWVEVRDTKTGKRYDAVFRTDGFKRRAKTFGNREAADAWPYEDGRTGSRQGVRRRSSGPDG